METLNKSTLYYNNLKTVENYNFKEFVPEEHLSCCKNFSIIVTSKRRTGKSVLVRDICYHIKDNFDEVYIMSLTADLQPDLFNFVSKSGIINSFDEEFLDKLWSSQEKQLKKAIENKEDPDKINKVLIIFDDLIGDPKVRNSKILKSYFVAGRHLKISQIFLSQSFSALPPALRANVDLAICFYLDSEADREAFAKQYLSTGNTRQGILILEKLTRIQFQCCIVRNYITTQNPEENVHYYVANPNIKKFKMKNGNEIKGLGSSIPFSPSTIMSIEDIEDLNYPSFLPKIRTKK